MHCSKLLQESDNMAKTFDEVMERFRSIAFEDEFDMIVAIANGGIVPAGTK